MNTPISPPVITPPPTAPSPAPPSTSTGTPQPASVVLQQQDLEHLLNCAAERGAERCLAHLGLENGHAARDIRELRDLLWAWRDARRTAWQTTVKVITTGILAALLVSAAIKLKLMGGAQ